MKETHSQGVTTRMTASTMMQLVTMKLTMILPSSQRMIQSGSKALLKGRGILLSLSSSTHMQTTKALINPQ